MDNNNADFNYPGIIGKRVILTPYNDTFFEYIYALTTDSRWKYLWTNNRSFLSKREFHDSLILSLKSYYHNYMVILSKTTHSPQGIIYSYNYSSDGYVYITTLIDINHRFSYVGGDAGIIFHDFLFKHFPLRKIYCDVYVYNTQCINFLLHSGYVEEGRLKEHRFYGGKYYDLLTLAFYRDSFYQNYKEIPI